MVKKLGIIAGSGPLPKRIVETCQNIGRPYFVVAIHGEVEEIDYKDYDHSFVSLGKIGQTIQLLRKAECHDVVMAGPVNRPSLKNLKLDLRAIKLMSKFARTKNHGDDALLRLLVNELELEGFHVVGIDEILGQKSTAPVGVFSIHKPTASDQDDILLGVEVAKDLGRLDVGQSVVVQQKVILGVEAIEGTDSLLHRCANLRRDGVGGVLVKVKKPNQERRADLPTIGSKTVKLASEANLKGIAVEADETLIVDYDKVVQEAKDKGLFLIGIKLK